MQIARSLPPLDAIARLSSSDTLADAHRATIEPRPRPRGDVDVDLVVGLARLDEAATAEDARAMLSDRELLALLSDAHGFERLMSIVRESRGRERRA